MMELRAWSFESTCARGGSLDFTPAPWLFLFWANPRKTATRGPGPCPNVESRQGASSRQVLALVFWIWGWRALWRASSETKSFKSFKSEKLRSLGPAFLSPLASARPTQKSGCQQTSWSAGWVSFLDDRGSGLDWTLPSLPPMFPKAPQPKPKRTVDRCGRRRHARAAPRGQHGSSRPATGMLPLDRNPSRLG